MSKRSGRPEEGSPRKIPPLARLRRLFGYTRPYWLQLLIAMVGLVGASVLSMVYPYYFGQLAQAAFTDAVSRGSEDASMLLRQSALTLLAVFVAQAVFVFVRSYFSLLVGQRVVTDLRKALFWHLLGLSRDFFLQNRTGELLSRMSDDVTRLHMMVSLDLSMGLRNLFTLVGGLAVLFWTNARLTLVMLAVVPPLVLMAVFSSRIVQRLSRKVQDQLAEASAHLQERISAIDTVQAFTREPHEHSRYGEKIEETFHLTIKRSLARSWFLSGATLFGSLGIGGIFWLGGRMIIRGEISSGSMVSFLLYTVLIATAVGRMSELVSNVQATLGSTARLFEILDTKSDISDGPVSLAPESVKGRVALEGVHFGYGTRETEVLRGIELSIEPSQVCALVGPSGAGKTTLARLLLRFWDPTAGSVRLDGHDLRSLKLADLRNVISLVSQEPVLFSGSLRENIRYGRLDATDAEVEEAARLANAHEFIQTFPEGYDTEVGERGVELSGGQRQRVAIARAILRNPRILVLDEPTSSLDSESEYLVQQALKKLQQGRTTLIIAHRLSTIREADRIVVLSRGQIVETGSHDELLARRGVYARLVQRQTESKSDILLLDQEFGLETSEVPSQKPAA